MHTPATLTTKPTIGTFSRAFPFTCLFTFSLALTSPTTLLAQQATPASDPINPLQPDKPRISQNATGCSIDWQSTPGRTYFTQYTQNLADWQFIPEIRSGDGSMLSTGFQCDHPEFFLRLLWSDLPTNGNPDTADFDGDGLSNREELTGDPQTHPLRADTDGDGLIDSFELNNGFNPSSSFSFGGTVSDGELDSDGDGFTNSQEQSRAGDPNDSEDEGRERILLDYELKSARVRAESYTCLNPTSDHAIEGCREAGHTGTVNYELRSSFGNSRRKRGPHTKAYIEATVQELFNSAEWYIERASVWVPQAVSAFYSSRNTSNNGSIRSSKSISKLRLSRDAPSDAPAIGTFLQTQTQIPEGSGIISSISHSILTLRIPPRAVKSPSHVFDLPLVDGERNRLDVQQLNTRILMDIDNDGEVDDRDLGLIDLATEDNATTQQKEEATEYLFANDNISNGLWDREDNSADKPQGVSEDDDAQEVTIRDGFRIRNGEVWFDHPAIFGLLFYETRECRNRIHMSPARPFKLETLTDKLPQKLYVRADPSRMDFAANNPQIEGDLVLKWRPEGMDENEDGLELSRIRLVVVEELGAKNYFHAARDYIEENNTKNYVADWTNQDHTYRIISMIESNTTMSTLDSFSETRGINAVVQANRAQDVIINGNQCFDVKNSLFPPYRMTRRCHGRLVSRGRILRPPSDDRTVGEGSPLAGPDGAYISQTNGNFTLKGGVVPEGATSAMGGLSTNYQARQNERSQLVGIARNIFSDDIIFTATQIDDNGGGGVPRFKVSAVNSGVRNSLDGTTNPIVTARSAELLALDGSISVGVAYKRPSGVLTVGPNPGLRQSRGIPQYVNTYLMFKSRRPR